MDPFSSFIFCRAFYDLRTSDFINTTSRQTSLKELGVYLSSLHETILQYLKKTTTENTFQTRDL